MRRILALIALLLLVVAPPVALLAWGFTDLGAIHLWSATDVRVLLAVLTLVGWLAWAAWMVALVVELVGALRGRRVRVALPGLSVPRALASALVAVVLASGAGVAHATPRVADDPAAALVVGEVAAASAPAHATPATPATLASLATPAAPPVAEVSAGPQHTVAPGDDLWSLAEKYYGQGGQWRRIVAANPALQADPMERLTPGTVLSVPDPVTLVTVQQGDTLSAIAAQHLGDADRWPEVHALNTQRVTDPDLILPGWVLKVPITVLPADAPGASVGGDEQAEPSASDDAGGPAETVELPAGSESAAPVATPADAPTSELLAPVTETAPAVGLLGGLTALSAAAVIGGVGLRRRIQEHQRPLGRRYVQPTGELARYEAALAQVDEAADGTDRMALLGRAMRHLAQHWWRERTPAARLEHVHVGPDDLVFTFSEGPAAPDAFTRVGSSLAITWAALDELPDVAHAVAYPALVTLGESEPGHLVMVDVMASGVLGVRDDEEAGAGEILSAMLVELACAPWAEELDLLVITPDARFADAAGEGRIVHDTEAEDGVATVERLARHRAPFIEERGWDSGRLDPDLAEAWSAQVILFEVPPTPDQLARLEAAIAQHPCGVAVIAPVRPEVGASVDWELTRMPDGARRLSAGQAEVVPQTVPAQAREALADLYQLANDTATGPAPWWEAPREEDVNIIALRPAPLPLPERAEGPRLNLLGPVELVGCAGEQPSRAVRQCIEYCAWLHLHPGSTPAQMLAALLVADGTRRSNMSRLRTWLGSRPDGALYLPDAYSGRIWLDESVSSDWEELTLLVTGGVNKAPLDRLVAALELVRGAPLADAAPGQWGWAEEFRSDAAALIRDVGVVAARAARQRGDLETARWAANRALVAAPDDELLLGERIRVEHAAGRTDEVQRLVTRVTRTARVLGLDLLPETVELCQESVEGRLRARAR